MDRLEAMAVAVAAAERQSFSAAARALRIPLSTVSRRVADLEAHLKTRLFVRASRRVTLTEEGEAYLAASRRILEAVDDAERAAEGEASKPTGQLVITAPLVFGRLHVVPVVTEFLKEATAVRVELSLSDSLTNLLEERVDLAVRIGALADSSLRAAHLGTVRLCTLASPAYLARRGRPKTPAELATHDCVQRAGQGWGYPGREKKVSVQPQLRLRVSTAEAALDASVLGLGVTRLFSYQVAEAVAAGRLEVLLGRFEPPPVPVSLVYAASGPLPGKLRAFLDHAVPRLKRRVEAVERRAS